MTSLCLCFEKWKAMFKRFKEWQEFILWRQQVGRSWHFWRKWRSKSLRLTCPAIVQMMEELERIDSHYFQDVGAHFLTLKGPRKALRICIIHMYTLPNSRIMVYYFANSGKQFQKYRLKILSILVYDVKNKIKIHLIANFYYLRLYTSRNTTSYTESH